MEPFIKPKPKQKLRRPPSTINPVLLVHGIDNNGKRFKAMQSALSMRGFEPVIAMDIIPSDASIPFEAMGAQVRDAILHILDITGEPKIDIVAYSMGALAARYYLQRLGGKSVIRRFISISGPHHGTFTANFRFGAGCRQMRPGSAFLQDLNSEIDPFGEVDVYSFYTPFDLMVMPSCSSILDHAHNRPFTVWLHPLMINHRRVIEAVAQTLMDDPTPA
jgi:triacylglycerol lipase